MNTSSAHRRNRRESNVATKCDKMNAIYLLFWCVCVLSLFFADHIALLWDSACCPKSQRYSVRHRLNRIINSAVPIESMTMVATTKNRREKKRSLIRRHFYRNRGRLDCAELIRAIRYMRLRNEEIAMLNFLSRLNMCISHVPLNNAHPRRSTPQCLQFFWIQDNPQR